MQTINKYAQTCFRIQWTLDLQTARLTDFSSYRLLWPQNLGSTCSQRIDLQTRKKPKWNKNGTKMARYRTHFFRHFKILSEMTGLLIWMETTFHEMSRGEDPSHNRWNFFFEFLFAALALQNCHKASVSQITFPNGNVSVFNKHIIVRHWKRFFQATKCHRFKIEPNIHNCQEAGVPAWWTGWLGMSVAGDEESWYGYRFYYKHFLKKCLQNLKLWQPPLKCDHPV